MSVDRALDRIQDLRTQVAAAQRELAEDRERLARLEVEADQDAARIDRIVSHLTKTHGGRGEP